MPIPSAVFFCLWFGSCLWDLALPASVLLASTCYYSCAYFYLQLFPYHHLPHLCCPIHTTHLYLPHLPLYQLPVPVAWTCIVPASSLPVPCHARTYATVHGSCEPPRFITPAAGPPRLVLIPGKKNYVDSHFNTVVHHPYTYAPFTGSGSVFIVYSLSDPMSLSLWPLLLLSSSSLYVF